MTAHTILERLITFVPDFAVAWADPGNCFREDDGSFTRCGVFAEFCSFFREHYERLPQERVAALGRFLTDCVASEDTELGDAAATCFLENVAAERFSPEVKRFLGGEALRFYSLWDTPTEPKPAPNRGGG